MENSEQLIPGYNRFVLHLNKFEPLLKSAAQSEDPAKTFYESSARQVLFYLQALARIYKKIHNKKRFERMRIAFKELEDQLGKVDYYDAFIKEFSVQKNFPPVLLENLKQHFSNELIALKKILDDQQWIDADFSALKYISEKLESADWKDAANDRRGVADAIILQIEKTVIDYESGKLNFKDLENGVHEFRRQLRWVSIYAQAVDGLVQLKKVDEPAAELKPYLTKEILESKFNLMPELKEGMVPIIIESPNFYALSWIINEIGNLKDDGLRIICIENAIRETKYAPETEVKKITRQLAIKSSESPRQIKKRVEIIVDDFINKKKVLKRIVSNVKMEE